MGGRRERWVPGVGGVGGGGGGGGGTPGECVRAPARGVHTCAPPPPRSTPAPRSDHLSVFFIKKANNLLHFVNEVSEVYKNFFI